MKRPFPLLLALLGVFASPALAQPAIDPTGTWALLGRDRGGLYAGRLVVRAEGAGVAGEVVELRRVRRAGPSHLALGAALPAQVRRGGLAGEVLTLRGETSGGIVGGVGGGGGGGDRAIYRRVALPGATGWAGATPEGREVLAASGPWVGAAEGEVVAVAPELLAAVGEGRPGDWGRPLAIPRTPFVHAGTTVGRAALCARYSVARQLCEAGPEVVYRLDAAAPGRVTAWVQGDDGAVDVDVHILTALTLDAEGTATAAVARDDRVCAARVAAGPVYVVVDTYAAAAQAGAYRLRVDFQPDDAWYERPLAEGVTLATKPYAELFGARQTGSVLRIDPTVEGVEVRPIAPGGCETVSRLASRAGAVAAVNGGFFGGQCRSVSLVKVDGQVLATNAKARTALGVDAEGRVRLERVAAGADWPWARHALGGVPRIVSQGRIDDRTAEEGSPASFSARRHPRTAAGVDAEGRLVLATVDGRTDAGAGMSLPELGQWMVWLGARDALNLDGGGSTTLWARGEPHDGVVNHPSDNGRADHEGQRPVGSALGVWARPLDRDARWLTVPPALPAQVGAAWVWEVVAADPEGAAVAYALRGADADRARLTDRGDGTARLEVTPVAGDAGRTLALEVEAQVAGSRAVRQPVRVSVLDD